MTVQVLSQASGARASARALPLWFDPLARLLFYAAVLAAFTGGAFLLPAHWTSFLRRHTLLHAVALALLYLSAALALGGRYVWGGKTAWQNLAEVRFAGRLAGLSPLWLLAMLTAVYGATKIAGLLLRHEAFFTAVCDLGWYDNNMWNILHGNFPRSLIRSAGVLSAPEPRFILYPVSLLYLLWDDVRMLLIFAGLAGAAVLPLLYAIAARLCRSSWAGLLFAFSWSLYAPATAVVRDDFHAGELGNPLLAAGFLAVVKRRPGLGLLFFGLALTTTESMTVSVLGAAAYFALRRETRRVGLGLLLLATCFAAIAAYVLAIGAGTGSPNVRVTYVQSLFNPNHWLPYLQSRLATSPAALLFLCAIFAPFAFFPVNAGRGWLLLAPILVFQLLISDPGFRDIRSHYMEGISLMTALAAIHGFARLKAQGDRPRAKLGAACILFASLIMAGPAEPFYLERLWKELSAEYLQWSRWLEATPQSFSVRATPMLAAHLAHRRALYAFGDPFSGESAERGTNQEFREERLRADAWPDLIFLDLTRDPNFWTHDPAAWKKGWDWHQELDHFRRRGHRLIFRSHGGTFFAYASPRLEAGVVADHVKRLEDIGRETRSSLRGALRRRASRFALKAFFFAPQDFRYTKKKKRYQVPFTR